MFESLACGLRVPVYLYLKTSRGLSGELEHLLSLLPTSVSHTNIYEHNGIFQTEESISDLKRIRKRKSNGNLRDTKTEE